MIHTVESYSCFFLQIMRKEGLKVLTFTGYAYGKIR